VLQAGTAVMVDATGTPRVKCNCGNPLTPPELINPMHYRGTAWPGYTPTQVTVVKGGTTASNITVMNITTGDNYTQSTGSSAGEWVAAEELGLGTDNERTVIVTSTDGLTWTTAATRPGDRFAALAYGDGKWVAVAPYDVNSNVYVSTDLHTWKQVAIIAAQGFGVAYGNGRWVIVGAQGGQLQEAVAYTSTDLTSWTQATAISGPIQREQLQGLRAVAFGDGKWLAVASREDPYGLHGHLTYSSTDGVTWTAEPLGLGVGYKSRIAFGAGHFVVSASNMQGSDSSILADGTIEISTDGHALTNVPSSAFTGNGLVGIAYGNGWLAVASHQDDPHRQYETGSFTSTFFTSPDAKSWSPAGRLPVRVVAIAFGGASRISGTTASSTPEPTSTATSTLGAAAPCGGAATIPAAMAISPHLGPDFEITPQIAPSDPTWARIDEQPKPGTGAGPGYGVVHCVGGKWELTGTGTDQVGCNEPYAVPIPLRAELNIHCP
jgi:hypothetical protein